MPATEAKRENPANEADDRHDSNAYRSIVQSLLQISESAFVSKDHLTPWDGQDDSYRRDWVQLRKCEHHKDEQNIECCDNPNDGTIWPETEARRLEITPSDCMARSDGNQVREISHDGSGGAYSGESNRGADDSTRDGDAEEQDEKRCVDGDAGAAEPAEVPREG